MIASYFFIPANHPKLIEKLYTVHADFLIIDLEDAVEESERNKALTTISSMDLKSNLWIRPVVFEPSNQVSLVFNKLVQSGFKNFIIPKIRNLFQLKQLENSIGQSDLGELKIILLVENPECLLNLHKIIESSIMRIEGIGFGSQDYCTETGMKHNFDYLRVPRFQIMNIAKAYGVKCIDIACMDTQASAIFKNELRESHEMGYDGKFLIHPNQLKALQQFPFHTREEIKEAMDVIESYERMGKPAVFVFKNNAVEPPHIKQYLNIIKWSQNYESK